MITITCDRCGRDITEELWKALEKGFVEGDVELQKEHNERLGTMLFHQEVDDFQDSEIAICQDCARTEIRSGRVKIVK